MTYFLCIYVYLIYILLNITTFEVHICKYAVDKIWKNI